MSQQLPKLDPLWASALDHLEIVHKHCWERAIRVVTGSDAPFKNQPIAILDMAQRTAAQMTEQLLQQIREDLQR